MSINRNEKTKLWDVRVSYKDKYGKYRTKNKKGFATKKEAEYWENQTKSDAENGFETEPDKIIFYDYFMEWYELYKEDRVSLSTQQKYLAVARFIKEYFGQATLVSISRKEYQKFLDLRGKNRDKDSVEKTHYYVKAMVGNAIADDILQKDFTNNAVIRYDNEPTNRILSWSLAETDRFNEYLRESLETKDVMLYIAINTGLRIGEVFGLAYNDITDETLSVNRGYDYNHRYDFTNAKNAASIRTIAINDTLYRKINQYKLANQKYNKSFLFLDGFNRPKVSHTQLNKYLKQICQQLEISTLTLHGLRHTHCSVLLYHNFNINYISKRLGHSSVIETSKTYSHIIDELNQKQNNKLFEVMDNESLAN